jgi:hypothetical protein
MRVANNRAGDRENDCREDCENLCENLGLTVEVKAPRLV